MRFEKFSFGSIRLDGVTYEHDVVIDRGQVSKRKKKPSKYRDAFGHTPLSVEEKIPWKCKRLVIGTGRGALPVMKEVKREATRHKIKLMILPTGARYRADRHHRRERVGQELKPARHGEATRSCGQGQSAGNHCGQVGPFDA